MAKLADDPASEAAKNRLAEENKHTEKVKQNFLDKQKGKPTPTQEENDLAALGGHILEHEADGSDPDPNITTTSSTASTKQVEADKPGAYQTRQATAPHRSSRE